MMHATLTPGARWSFAGLLLLVGALVLRDRSTPTPLTESAPVTEFASGRALVHLREIAQRPHPPGSTEHARVGAYLVEQLRAMGLDPQVQEATAVGTRYPVAGRVRNVLARVPGREPGGKAVLIAVHYDGVGASPAASDDGAGTAALLETLRALRAGPPLAHDLIALFTDGEESGLLGAAAFAREHPWAADVEVTLNFEARGTGGRSVMFETGAGNLDVARVLASVRDVTASSLLVTVYRSLPNDTDLSEIAQLGKPALNFAFVDGVERYHTAHDDVAHLDPGSLQHHGAQMLALARAFGAGPLPRPVTGDAVFFDLPFVGVVGHPVSWALPLALLAAVLALVGVARTVRREGHGVRGLLLGVTGLLVATAVAGLLVSKAGGWVVALHERTQWDGAPGWSGVYAAAFALLALAVSSGAWALLRRWAGARPLHAGALLVWALLALVVAARLPGASHLFTWPVMAMALAGFGAGLFAGSDAEARVTPAGWTATIVAGVLLIPVIHTTGAYTLPLDGPGATVVGVLVPMFAWLLAPHLEALGGARRWPAAGWLSVAALAVAAMGAMLVRRSEARPTLENLTYVTSLDADSAWLGAPLRSVREGGYAHAALGPSPRELGPVIEADSSRRWIRQAGSFPARSAVRALARTLADGPDAEVLGDTVLGEERRLTVRFRAPAGTLLHRVSGAAYLRAVSVDGRTLDTARYRRVPTALSLPFTAPPDSGFTAVLALPRDSAAVVQLAAFTAGLPAVPGLAVPDRPRGIVAVQNGDVTVRHRRVDLAVPRASAGPSLARSLVRAH